MPGGRTPVGMQSCFAGVGRGLLAASAKDVEEKGKKAANMVGDSTEWLDAGGGTGAAA